MFFIILFGMATDPASNFNIIQEILPEHFKDLSKFSTSFVGIVIVTFAFGFVISTFSNSLVRFCYLLRSHCKFHFFNGLWNGPAVNWEWDKDAKEKLENLFQLDQWRKDGEFCEHAVLSKVPESLRTYVQRKWEFFQTNLNSFIAICLANLLFQCLKINPKWCYYWPIILFFIVILLYNGYTSYKDAMRMDHFLLRNIDTLSKSEGVTK